jgi:lysosomal alpha-mannosidase
VGVVAIFRRNYAESYQYQNTEPISGNYYPINSRIILSDNTTGTSMAILTDRSHGGSSLVDGQVEIMLHRREMYLDYFGPHELLDEPGRDGRGLVVRGKHWLIIGNDSEISKTHRTLAYELFHAPVLTFSNYSSGVDQYRKDFVTQVIF